MAVHELTSYLDADLRFGRGETPAFQLNFTGVTAPEVAAWLISASIRRAAMLEPLADWDVTVEGTEVTFSLGTDVTDTLPDHTGYTVRIETDPTNVHVPMGGRLLLRETDVC